MKLNVHQVYEVAFTLRRNWPAFAGFARDFEFMAWSLAFGFGQALNFANLTANVLCSEPLILLNTDN